MINRLSIIPFKKILSLQFKLKATHYPFSKKQFVLNEQQIKNPIRVPFQTENILYLNEILHQKQSKTSIQSKNLQFINFLKEGEQSKKKQFQDIGQEVAGLYNFIKKEILFEKEEINNELVQMAHYYFKNEGKKIRPIMIELLSKCFDFKSDLIKKDIRKWGALIEMMHISSLAHDDIIDDSPSRRGLESQHLKYGKRPAVFSANYIISKASHAIYDFQKPKLYEIYSVTMDDLATGEIIQALTKNNVVQNQKELQKIISTYMNKTYFKTAALMAHSLRAVPLFFQNPTVDKQIVCFRIGQHFGMAFQLVDDILDYTSTASQMGKQELADIIQGNVTGPVLFNLQSELNLSKKKSNFMLQELRKKNKNKQEAEKIKQWIQEGLGLQLTLKLAAKHVKRALQFTSYLENPNEQIWRYLGYKILSRKK